MTTTPPSAASPNAGPVDPGTEGTAAGPWTTTYGPPLAAASPAPPVPVSPPSGGTQPGTDPGTERGTRQSRRAAGPGSRPPGSRSPGRKIAGSRLIPGTEVPVPKGKIAWVLGVISVALVVVTAAPTLLSSQDLFHWAKDPRGLGLTPGWAVMVPVALDLAALTCIGMTLVAAWRRERAHLFGLLVFVFAGTSAYAQYSHGIAARDRGGAQDAWWAFPALALLGPILIEITLQTIRKWARKDAGERGRATRWLVSPWRSLAAWAYAQREDLTPAEAWFFARDKKLLKTMAASPIEAVIHAANALQTLDQYAIRQWLAARKFYVSQEHLDAGMDRVPTDLWDAGDSTDAGTGPVPVPPIPSAGPRVSPPSGGTDPSGPGGTGGAGNAGGGGTESPVPPRTESAGTGGTEPVISLVDGTDLAALYERHRERLITVKTNLLGWDAIPEKDLSTDAIKTAGKFGKQQYACDIRKVLLHERAKLAAARG